LAPENSQYKQLRAAYARVQGDQDAAVALFEEIYQSTPSTVSMLNLQQQYKLAGDEAAARMLLQTWVQEHAEDNSARMALANSYLLAGDEGKLIEEYTAVLQADEKNVVALNNLAWSLLNDQPKLALEYAQKAVAITKKSPDVLDTLALAQSANGMHDEATATIKSALLIAPGNGNYLYHSALIANAAGHKNEALKVLGPLLEGNKKFVQRAEAIKLLEALSKGQ